MSGSLASFLKLKMGRGYSTPQIYGQLKHYLRYTRFSVHNWDGKVFLCLTSKCNYFGVFYDLTNPFRFVCMNAFFLLYLPICRLTWEGTSCTIVCLDDSSM